MRILIRIAIFLRPSGNFSVNTVGIQTGFHANNSRHNTNAAYNFSNGSDVFSSERICENPCKVPNNVKQNVQYNNNLVDAYVNGHGMTLPVDDKMIDEETQVENN